MLALPRGKADSPLYTFGWAFILPKQKPVKPCLFEGLQSDFL